MTNDDFLQVETALGIKIPSRFRMLIQNDFERLKRVAWFVGDSPIIFLDPELIISTNLAERDPTSGTGAAFPDWWSQYFIFGSYWGGDYFALKLDDSPEVWDIGWEAGEQPKLLCTTLEEFIEDKLADWEVERVRREKIEIRRAPYQEEIAAHLAAIAAAGNPTNAQKWQLCMSNGPMPHLLDGLWVQPSPRKWILIGIACCRQISEIEADEVCQTALTRIIHKSGNKQPPRASNLLKRLS